MLKKIQNKIFNKKYRITYHCQRRCDKRNISIYEIIDVIFSGEIIESYKQDKPYPSFLILGYIRNQKPLYVLCAINEIVHIITAHWLDPKKWLDPKTRREKRL